MDGGCGRRPPDPGDGQRSWHRPTLPHRLSPWPRPACRTHPRCARRETRTDTHRRSTRWRGGSPHHHHLSSGSAGSLGHASLPARGRQPRTECSIVIDGGDTGDRLSRSPEHRPLPLREALARALVAMWRQVRGVLDASTPSRTLRSRSYRAGGGSDSSRDTMGSHCGSSSGGFTALINALNSSLLYSERSMRLNSPELPRSSFPSGFPSR